MITMNDASNVESGLHDIHSHILISITQFVAYKQPSTLTKLRRINKHWSEHLNPNIPSVNLIWQHNICRMMFPFTPKSLKMKRWDRYFKLKHSETMQAGINWNRSGHHSTANSQPKIQGCSVDIEVIKTYQFDDNEPIFSDTVDISTGLPSGFKWKLICPINRLNLFEQSTGIFHCNICNKNVYHVTNTKQLSDRVRDGHCVKFVMVSDKHNLKSRESLQLLEFEETDKERKLMLDQYSKLLYPWQRQVFIKKKKREFQRKKMTKMETEKQRYRLMGMIDYSAERENTDFSRLKEKQTSLRKQLNNPNYLPERKKLMEHALELQILLAEREFATIGFKEAGQIMIDYLKEIDHKLLIALFELSMRKLV